MCSDSVFLKLNFHVLMLDGVYVEGDETLVFLPASPLSDPDVQQMVQTSARRIIRLYTKRGLLAEADPLAEEEPVLAALTAASVHGSIATGQRAGKRLRRILKDPATGVRTAPLCFASRGFSLHAATRTAARAGTAGSGVASCGARFERSVGRFNLGRPKFLPHLASMGLQS